MRIGARCDRRISFTSPDGRPVVNGIGAQTRVTGGEATLDNLVAAGLGGGDTATIAVGVTSQIPLHFDGGDGDDTAKYNGTDGPDQISIAPNGGQVATFSPGGAVFNSAAVESLVVSGFDGDDLIAGSNGIATLTKLTIDGGDGADDLRGGDGDDILLGRAGDDSVDGNRGTDQALLGTGDDRFQWDPGDGNDTVEGQGGKDTLDFNGSNAGEEIALAADGSRVRLTRNIAAIVMDLNSIDTVNVRALGSSDLVTVGDLSGTSTKTVNVDLSAVGGGGDGATDTVVVTGTDHRDVVHATAAGPQVSVTGLPATTNIVGSEGLNDTLRIQTLGGNDDVTVSPDVELLMTPVIDLGADE